MKKATALRLLLAAAISTSLIGVGVTPAHASVTGKWECYQFDPYSGYLYTGWYKLQAGGHYTVGSGNGGNYVYNSGTKKLTFKTGSMKYAYGKRVGRTKFDMYFKNNHDKYGYCDKI
jgi:hypothetical protein